jgi:hypothetical protein
MIFLVGPNKRVAPTQYNRELIESNKFADHLKITLNSEVEPWVDQYDAILKSLRPKKPV